MSTCKSFPRNFKIGQPVNIIGGGRQLRVLKYDDKLSEDIGKPIVTVTWLEKRKYHIKKVLEEELIPYSINYMVSSTTEK